MEQQVHLTVATVVCEQDKFLLVKEHVRGIQVINQPAGHWEPGESLIAAAQRETLEETGYSVTIDALLGVRLIEAADGEQFCRFSFSATLDSRVAGSEIDPDIDEVIWLSYEEMQKQHGKMRHEMVLQTVDMYRKGQRYPLELLRP